MLKWIWGLNSNWNLRSLASQSPVSHQSVLLPSFALLPVILVQVVAPAGGAPFFKQMFIANNEVYGHF